LKFLLLLPPVLPPMGRYVQVGTILELGFLRNNIFPGYPVIRTILIHHQTASLSKSSATVGFSINLSMLLLGHPALPPVERSVQVRRSLQLWFLRNNNFPVFPVIQKNRIRHQTASPPKPSGQVGFQGIFIDLLLLPPVLPPMERSVQVGRSLEL